MTVVDIIILVVLLIYVAKGFSNGVIKESVSFVGGIGVIIIAFLLKNPVSIFMYQHLPFFKFGGLLSGLSVLNVIIYELVAFLLVASILMLIYQVILRMTNIFETLLKITFVFALPSKLLGAVVGFVEGMIITFLVLFACVQFEATRDFVNDSKFGTPILQKTPILSTAISPVYDSLKEIYKVAENYKDSTDRDKANLECLDILLKYKVLDPSNAETLVESGKLAMPGIESVIDKYKDATD